MDVSFDQPPPPPSSLRRFWRTWRREILRGGMLFGMVVGVGLVISRVRVGGVPQRLLSSVSGFDIDLRRDLFGPGREVGDQWEWRAPVKASQQVWIRNTNGPVEVLRASGDMLEVIAEKSWRRSSPDMVHMMAVPSHEGVTICAVWAARESSCGGDGVYRLHDVRRNDVAVRFTVKLPRGAKIDVSTVNGEVVIGGAGAPVAASTVNGRIEVHTAVGPVKATTINGSIEAVMDALSGGDVELETVNGSVTAALPPTLNAVLDAETVNGRVETEFPVQMTGKISPRHVRGTIGAGGPTLKLNTVNGSITIQQAPHGTTRVNARTTRRTVRVERIPTPPPPPPQQP